MSTIIINSYTPFIRVIENLNKMSLMTNIPKDSFRSAMLHSLRFPAQINPYHPDKYINFRSKFADALLNQPGTNTAKALLRAGVIVHPSFTMAGLIHDRYFSSVNRFAGLLGQSVSQRQMDFAAKLQRLQPLLNPEYVRITSWLAEQDVFASEIEKIKIPLPKNDINILANAEEREAFVKEIIKTNSEVLIQNQKLVIDYHNTDSNLFNWRELENKSSYIIALFELIDFFFRKLVNELDASIISEYISTIKALVFVCILLEAWAGAFNHGCNKNTD